MTEFLADSLLWIHVLFVLGVALPVPLIILGKFFGWGWVRNFKLRLLHMCMIGFVVFESLVGMMCPLTVWENDLREKLGAQGYGDSFIASMLHRVLFWNLPPPFFTALYCGFGALVAFLWWWVRPVGQQKL